MVMIGKQALLFFIRLFRIKLAREFHKNKQQIMIRICDLTDGRATLGEVSRACVCAGGAIAPPNERIFALFQANTRRAVTGAPHCVFHSLVVSPPTSSPLPPPLIHNDERCRKDENFMGTNRIRTRKNTTSYQHGFRNGCFTAISATRDCMSNMFGYFKTNNDNKRMLA